MHTLLAGLVVHDRLQADLQSNHGMKSIGCPVLWTRNGEFKALGWVTHPTTKHSKKESMVVRQRSGSL